MTKCQHLLMKPSAHLSNRQQLYSKNAYCRGRCLESYRKITVCGEISLFQIDDNRGDMERNKDRALSQHKAFIIILAVQSVLPPSCLSQTRGRRFIIT